MYRYKKGLFSGGSEYTPDTEELFSSVLLIEDDAAHASLIQRALKGVVGEVSHVASGNEGLKVLERSYTELVFCDMHLPDCNGIELIQQVRQVRPGLPIIIITSSNDLNEAVKAMREGAWDFMVKQFSDDLRAQIQIVVERTAERKLQQMRELEVRAERDAFSVAAFTALDGLAILSERGQVVFANEAFQNFSSSLGAEMPQEGLMNLVDSLALRNYTVAGALREALQAGAADSLWSSELELSLPREGQKPTSVHYQLTLSTVSPSQLDSFGIDESVVSSFRYHVLWLRDVTRKKEQERFQRDLLSTTTHDLKGPLGAILTSAELLAEVSYSEDPKANKLLTRIASCARNSISIIDELLSARRIQDGVLVVKPRWYEVDELLEDIVLDYFPMAKAKELKFSSAPVEAGLKVYADRLGLNRVLGNLVNNAIKFTPRKGKVQISARRVGSSIQIEVADTGPGIDPSVRHKLFERFSRLEQHDEIEGTGLGLFVSRNIVEAHNGKIELRSEVGKGTSFVLTLPDEK